VVSGAVFRPSRSPAPVAFDALGHTAAPQPVEPMPAFELVGVVLGPMRAAAIRGIPGFDGAQVLTEGEERAGLAVIRIDSSGVVARWRGDSLRLALAREGT
jgi:hypothetical protein